jgi:hypothetical protein
VEFKKMALEAEADVKVDVKIDDKFALTNISEYMKQELVINVDDPELRSSVFSQCEKT